jgi:hypothetical protein
MVFPLTIEKVRLYSRKIAFRRRDDGDEIDVSENIGEMFPILEM